MNSDYTKGTSKLKINFFKSDTCLKEENGNMTIIRKLFLDGEKSNKFYYEQRELYRQYVSSKVRESVGPIQDATIREFEPKLEKLELTKKLHYDGINAGSFNVLFNSVKKITL